MTAIDSFACPLVFSSRVAGDEIVQGPTANVASCQDIVAMNATNGIVRRAPLEVFGERYSVIGVLNDDTVWGTATTDERTRITASESL